MCRRISSGGTPLKSRDDYYVGGSIPWLRTQEVRYGDIFDTGGRITELGMRESSAKWIPENCVIVAISGASAGRVAVNKIPLATNQHCLNMEIDPAKASYRYVYYCMCSKTQVLLARKEGARGDLNATRIKTVEIPVPPLEIQDRIVSVLDRFDALTTSLTDGLPAEIEARRKQYEYYRDKLLDFPRKESA